MSGALDAILSGRLEPVANLAGVRQIPTTPVLQARAAVQLDTLQAWVFVETAGATVADDGIGVLLPDDRTVASAGRWYPWQGGNPLFTEDVGVSGHVLPSALVDQDRAIADAADYDYVISLDASKENRFTVIADVYNGTDRGVIVCAVDVRRVSTANASGLLLTQIATAAGWTLTASVVTTTLVLNLANGSGANGVASVYADPFKRPNVASPA